MSISFWETAGCVLRGRMHSTSGEPCQDRISSFTVGNVTAISLADGAGSASLSHFGAARYAGVICRKLCSGFAKLMDVTDVNALKKTLLDYLRHKAILLSSELGCDADDLHSTLIAAASDGERYIVVHIGDGIAGAFSGGSIAVMSEPYNDGIATRTDSPFSPSVIRHMNIVRGNLSCDVGSISGFVLMSDGTQPGYYNKGSELPPL